MIAKGIIISMFTNVTTSLIIRNEPMQRSEVQATLKSHSKKVLLLLILKFGSEQNRL